MEKYTAPEAEVILLGNEDVISTSGGGETDTPWTP